MSVYFRLDHLRSGYVRLGQVRTGCAMFRKFSICWYSLRHVRSG